MTGIVAEDHRPKRIADETTELLDVPADLLRRESVERVDLLKCDVEGAEFDALLGAEVEVLRKVERIAVELHLTSELPAGRADALRAHLRVAGFELEEEEGPEMYGGTLKQLLLHGWRQPSSR